MSHVQDAGAAGTQSRSFAELGLLQALRAALSAEGYQEPTPIQLQAIPHVLAGRDLLGCAQTGTGKTAAFMLPLLQRLERRRARGHVRALVLTPTRELAGQIAERAGAYGCHLGLRHAVIYGGVGQRNQERALAEAPELLVATPGRLLDLMQQGFVRLDKLEILVLDEADRMLDMGFIHDVRRIVAAIPKQRQTLLFSATMAPSILELARGILIDPVRVSVAPPATTPQTVEESVYHVARADKASLLVQLLQKPTADRAIVFSRTKHGADRLVRQLVRAGIHCEAIHGNKSQSARERALEGLRHGRLQALIATDVAARGIDVRGISHVINYDLPNVAESYVHRIGRTGRAGERGSAISFCDRDELDLLKDIERLIRRRIPAFETPALPQGKPGASAPRDGAADGRAAGPKRSRRRRRGPPPRGDRGGASSSRPGQKARHATARA